MDKSWDGICKVGIVQFMIYPSVMKGEGPVVETVTKIATDEFFGAMEITHVADPEARKEVANIIATSHMTVGYGAQPVLLSRGLNLNHLGEAERMKAVDRSDWPGWWEWELELTSHLLKRMVDRHFSEVDLRGMIETATGLREEEEVGRRE